MKNIILSGVTGTLLIIGANALGNALVPPVAHSDGMLVHWLTPSSHPVRHEPLTFTLEFAWQPRMEVSAVNAAEGNEIPLPSPREARAPWTWPKVAVVPTTKTAIHRPESGLNTTLSPGTPRKIG